MLETELEDIVFDLWENAEYIGACVDNKDGSALYIKEGDLFIIWYYDNFRIKNVELVTSERARKCFPDVLL